MSKNKVQDIIDRVLPQIAQDRGLGKKGIPKIKLHHDIYARLSGDDKQRGEHSKTTKAQYDENTNIIWIYYPNIKTEEDILRSLIHEYTHYRQDHKLFKQYRQMYSYNENPIETMLSIWEKIT